MAEDTYIPLSSCENGRIYRLNSRNLEYGIFNSNSNGFTGVRLKFSHVFLFEEFHWDTGAPYGTAKPIEAGDLHPELLDNKESLFLELLKLEHAVMKRRLWELEKAGLVG